MKTYHLKRTQQLPITIDQAWAFFSSPLNLARITPPSLDFKVTSEVPNEIYSGLIIHYNVKPLLGIPMRWQTLIKDVQKPRLFVDEQLKGPYQRWHHTHEFIAIPQGVEIHDHVEYQIGFGPIGTLLHPILVAPRLEEIFSYRRLALEKIFGIMPS